MKIKSIVIAVAATAILSGCATTGSGSIDNTRLAKSAGIGCALGGVGALIFGGDRSDAIKSCVVAGGVGALASYQAQMKEARELEASARAAGMQAVVSTRPVQTSEGQTTQAFDGIVMRYNGPDVVKRTPATVQVFDRLGALGQKAQNELSVTTNGSTGCAEAVSMLVERQVFAKHKLINQCGSGDSVIQVTPLPVV